ncbi:MAG: TVP38/TMEM64 family protein [PS1 clade bacterium]|nr:TVP38/TMEM64 family protein [PS1 clade bacterium]
MVKTTSPKTTKTAKRFLVLALFMCGLSAFLFFDLGSYLSYQALVENEEYLRRAVAAHHLPAAAAYVGTYMLAVALSLPGAIWLTLSGGLLFGVWLGGALAVLGAGTGAIFMFLMAKYVLGDALRARFGPRLVAFEAQFNRDAWSYMLALRLLPVFPFFLVNLGAALVGVRLSVFALTTYIGIIPGAYVYASIGNGISVLLREGRQPDLSLASRPEIFGPLVALGVLALAPVVWRRFKDKQER